MNDAASCSPSGGLGTTRRRSDATRKQMPYSQVVSFDRPANSGECVPRPVGTRSHVPDHFLDARRSLVAMRRRDRIGSNHAEEDGNEHHESLGGMHEDTLRAIHSILESALKPATGAWCDPARVRNRIKEANVAALIRFRAISRLP